MITAWQINNGSREKANKIFLIAYKLFGIILYYLDYSEL